MNYETFEKLYKAAKESDNVNKYIRECGWDDWQKGINADDVSAILREIYYMAHDDINYIIGLIGRPVDFAREYGIPINTVRRWVHNIQQPPKQYYMLMAFATATRNL